MANRLVDSLGMDREYLLVRSCADSPACSWETSLEATVTIPYGIFEVLWKQAQKIHGPGCRMELSMGYGCLVYEVWRKGEESAPAERIIV